MDRGDLLTLSKCRFCKNNNQKKQLQITIDGLCDRICFDSHIEDINRFYIFIFYKERNKKYQ